MDRRVAWNEFEWTELDIRKYQINDIVRKLDAFIKFNLDQLMAFLNIACLAYNTHVYGIQVFRRRI